MTPAKTIATRKKAAASVQNRRDLSASDPVSPCKAMSLDKVLDTADPSRTKNSSAGNATARVTAPSAR